MGKALGFRLMDSIKELTEIEMSKEQLISAIYMRKTEEKIKQGIVAIENSLKAQADFYGVDLEKYGSRIQEIEDKYLNEINKIKQEYELQFVNMQLELRECNANKKIALANAKKMSDMKLEFMNSDKYQDYLANNPEFVKSTFGEYENKKEISMKKFYAMDSLIKSCEEKLKQCINETDSEIDKIINENIDNSLIVSKENVATKLINKVTNIFLGKSKFETKISNIENNINKLSSLEKENIEKIRNNTIKLVAEIKVEKDNLNEDVA